MFYLGVPCAYASWAGSVYIQGYIKKTKKTSFLLFILLGFMALAIVLSIFSNYKKVTHNIAIGQSVIRFSPYC